MARRENTKKAAQMEDGGEVGRGEVGRARDSANSFGESAAAAGAAKETIN